MKFGKEVVLEGCSGLFWSKVICTEVLSLATENQYGGHVNIIHLEAYLFTDRGVGVVRGIWEKFPNNPVKKMKAQLMRLN